MIDIIIENELLIYLLCVIIGFLAYIFRSIMIEHLAEACYGLCYSVFLINLFFNAMVKGFWFGS